MATGIGIGVSSALLGGGGFDPRALGNLVLWLDASKINAADGDAVATWADASGNGNNATQGTSGKRPVYKSGIINALPVVRFTSASSHSLDLSAINLTGTSGITVYAVFSASSTGDMMVFEMSASASAQTDSFYFLRSTANKVETTLQGNTGFSNFVSTATLTTTPKQVSAVYDKSLATNEITNWIDGTSAGTRPNNSNNTNAFGNRVLYIGGRAGTSLFFNGDLAELLLYTTAHADTSRVLVERYLRGKWGTA